MDQRVTQPHPGALVLRLALYGGLQLGAIYLHLLVSTGGDAASARAYLAEGSWIEWIQVGLLLAALILVLVGPGPRSTIRWVLACILTAALARELDTYFADYLWKRSHRVVMIAMTCVALAILWHRRRELAAALGGFLGRPGFWLMFLGVSVVTIYGVVLGQNAMWLEASAPGYDRVSKRFVEEGLEASGYLWILLGVVEEVLVRSRRAAAASP